MAETTVGSFLEDRSVEGGGKLKQPSTSLPTPPESHLPEQCKTESSNLKAPDYNLTELRAYSSKGFISIISMMNVECLRSCICLLLHKSITESIRLEKTSEVESNL